MLNKENSCISHGKALSLQKISCISAISSKLDCSRFALSLQQLLPMFPQRLYDGADTDCAPRAVETYRTEAKNELKPMSSHD